MPGYVLTTQINVLIEGDPARSDEGEGRARPPPAYMKHRDFREEYSCSVPGYGSLYELPREAPERLEVPVHNLGPVGKDAHELSERIHEGYAFETYPKLLRRAVPGAGCALEDSGR